MSVLARFVGGPLNGQERVLPNLVSPYMVQMMRPATSLDPDDYMNYDEHRYDLDSRDYEARREEIDRGSPALFVHEDLENVGRLLAASLGNLISFDEAYERASEVMETGLEGTLEMEFTDDDTRAAFVESMTEHQGRIYQAVLGNFIHHTPELHRAPDCENLPPHERCWPRGETWRTQGHPADIHGYGTPIFDEAGGASAEDLVPGIEAALREWNETKKEIDDDNDRD